MNMQRLLWHFVMAMCWLAFGTATWADTVRLARGGAAEGIVIRETDDEVVVQVAWQGHLVLNRASVIGIERSSEADRQALLSQWRQEDLAFKEQQRQQREFEEHQQAKGLVLYRGRWVTQEELVSIKGNIQEAEAEHKKR